MWKPIDKNLTKICSICKVRKLKTAFYPSPSGKDGFMAPCKKCMKERTKTRVDEKVRNGTFDFNKVRYRNLVKQASKENTFVNMSQEEFSNWWDVTPNVCCFCKEIHSDMRKKVEAYEGSNDNVNRFKPFFIGDDIITSRIDFKNNYTETNIIKVCSICRNVRGLFFTYLEMVTIGTWIVAGLLESLDDVDNNI